MKIRELFVADVTRDIPPVIYFHEQSPEKLRAEVDEYIVTGGFPAGHPHHKRVPMGIHEQYVRLLRAIAADIGKQGGSGLPAAWISGVLRLGQVHLRQAARPLAGPRRPARRQPPGRRLATPGHLPPGRRAA